MLIVKASCPHCGAPLGLEEGQRYAVCAYCDTSLKVEAPPVGASVSAVTAPTLTERAVPEGTVKRVKELVLAAKREEAIELYASATGVPREEAAKAVKQLVQLDLLRLLRRAPINAFGFLLAGLPISLSAWSLERGLSRGLEGELGYFALALLCVFVIVNRILWLIPKAISTYVARFGSEGRARVVKRVVMESEYVKGGALVLVLFEVTPAAGGSPFLDEEPMIIRSESLEKLTPGNVIRVRYSDPGRERVFPISPVTVVGRA